MIVLVRDDAHTVNAYGRLDYELRFKRTAHTPSYNHMKAEEILLSKPVFCKTDKVDQYRFVKFTNNTYTVLVESSAGQNKKMLPFT